jgi:DNA-binding Lrp family transcriptional regulator
MYIAMDKLDKDILNKLKEDFRLAKQDFQLATSEEEKNKALASCKKISDLLYQKFGIANYQG